MPVTTTERLVTAIKTLLPNWLEIETLNFTGLEDPVQDKWRRFSVQLISFFCAWITTSFFTDPDLKSEYLLLGCVDIGNDFHLPAFIVALLSMGGSAFWNNILGYSKAVKDNRIQRQRNERLMFNQRSKFLNAPKFYDVNEVIKIILFIAGKFSTPVTAPHIRERELVDNLGYTDQLLEVLHIEIDKYVKSIKSSAFVSEDELGKCEKVDDVINLVESKI